MLGVMLITSPDANGGNHDFRKRRAALAHRHSSADHPPAGVVLAL